MGNGSVRSRVVFLRSRRGEMAHLEFRYLIAASPRISASPTKGRRFRPLRWQCSRTAARRIFDAPRRQSRHNGRCVSVGRDGRMTCRLCGLSRTSRNDVSRKLRQLRILIPIFVNCAQVGFILSSKSCGKPGSISLRIWLQNRKLEPIASAAHQNRHESPRNDDIGHIRT